MRLILSLLLLLAPIAQAQTACNFWTQAQGHNVQAVQGSYVATWHCRDADRYAGWQRQAAVLMPSVLAPEKVEAVKAAATAGDFPTLLTLRDRPLTDPLFAPALAAAEYRAPPGPWVVAKNGTATTRPVRNGLMVGSTLTLGDTLTARATVGARCFCPLRVINGTATWCHVPGAAPMAMAVCVEVQL